MDAAPFPMLEGLAALALVAAAAATAPWRSVQSNERSHVWWGAILVVTIAWMMRPELAAGLRLHFIGATVLVLMFGARLALLGIAIASALAAVVGPAAWHALPRDLLLGGALPVAVSTLVLRFVETRLPAHVFIYIFVAGFLAGGLATFAADAVVLFATPAPGALGVETGALAVIALLLAFAEATLTGMLVSIMVAYRPAWLASFDDRRYLGTRTP
jgi:uncharacterized membrane protein